MSFGLPGQQAIVIVSTICFSAPKSAKPELASANDARFITTTHLIKHSRDRLFPRGGKTDPRDPYTILMNTQVGDKATRKRWTANTSGPSIYLIINPTYSLKESFPKFLYPFTMDSYPIPHEKSGDKLYHP